MTAGSVTVRGKTPTLLDTEVDTAVKVLAEAGKHVTGISTYTFGTNYNFYCLITWELIGD